MDETQDTGVENQAEGETAASSPASEETPQAEVSEETRSEETGAEESTDKHVPYDRFKEVNDKARQYEERLRELESKIQTPPQSQETYDPQAEQVKQTLKQYGFVSKDEVDAELRRLREDSALEQRLSQLENSFSGKDGRPKFDRQQVVQFAVENQIADPEAAYKLMHEKELINWHVAQATNKASGVKTEKSDGSGTPKVGPSSDELREAAMKGDTQARDALLSRTGIYQKWFGNN